MGNLTAFTEANKSQEANFASNGFPRTRMTPFQSMELCTGEDENAAKPKVFEVGLHGRVQNWSRLEMFAIELSIRPQFCLSIILRIHIQRLGLHKFNIG